MSYKNKNIGRLDHDCFAGAIDPFKSLCEMKAQKRTPLLSLSDNFNTDLPRNKRFSKEISQLCLSLHCSERILNDSDTEIFNTLKKQKKYWVANFDGNYPNISAEIVFNLIEAEKKSYSLSLYMSEYTTLTPYMRGTLIDWMADVTHGCQSAPETLFMAVNYLDRFISHSEIKVTKLQLVGITCLFLSSKLNDITVPQIKEFAYVTENLYTPDDIIDAEKEILSVLEFNLLVPTVLFFAEFYSTYFYPLFEPDQNCLYIQALCEYSLLDYNIINSYYPSVLAAAILMIVSFHFGSDFDVENFSQFNLDLLSISSCCYSVNLLISSIDYSPHTNSIERFKALWTHCSELSSPIYENNISVNI